MGSVVKVLLSVESPKYFSLKPSLIEKEVAAHLRAHGTRGKAVEVRVVGPQTMRRLNRKSLGHDYPTDVLSFPLPEIPGEIRMEKPVIGTIIICSDIINSYAEKNGSNYKSEFIFVLRHGLNHLVGVHHK